MRCLLISIAALLATAAPAAAADISLGIAPVNGLQYGGEHRFRGFLTENGAPLAGQVVTLHARRFPYEGDFAVLQQATTGANGAFEFHQRLDRNHDVRVSGADAISQVRTAFVYPRISQEFKALRRGRLRLIQRYRTAADVILTERTHFYLGRGNALLGRLVGRASTEQVGAGRFVSRVVVRLPRSFKGRFQFGGCIPGDLAAGMGDPDKRCPPKLRFRR